MKFFEEDSNKAICKTEETTESFDTWINKPFIPESLKVQLQKANILIVPLESFRDKNFPMFPGGTEELFRFLKENENEEICTDICINDSDYKELVLHNATIIFGSFIVTAIIGPILADLIAEYIKRRWSSKSEKRSIKIELTTVSKDGKSAKLVYEGPSDEFQKTVMPILKVRAKEEIG